MNWLKTHSGREVTLAKPRPEAIDIRDIAHHLAGLARFNAATEFPYSVAQHSVVVARILQGQRQTPRVQMLGLLHDAHEAFLGDITAPVHREIAARSGGADVIAEIKAEFDAAILARFQLLWPSPELRAAVEAADRTAFITEWVCMMPGRCPIKGEPARMAITPWNRDKAEQNFLETFATLARDIGPLNPPSGILK